MTTRPPGRRAEAGVTGWTNRALVQLTTGIRVTNHAVLATRAVFETGRSRRWLGVAGLSIALDLALARRLTDPTYVPGWGRWTIGWLDGAVWAHATESRSDVMGLMAAAAMMPTVESSFGAFAGTEAVPVHQPARPWPPRGLGDAADRAAKVLATVLVPTVVTAVVHRRRGLAAAPAHLPAVAAAAVLSAATARQRSRLHRAERRRWAERTDVIVQREFDGGRATMAFTSSPGHDFKKTLFALGHHGSPAALTEALRQTQHPESVRGDLDGQTLFEVTLSDRLVPPEAGATWVTNGQAEQIERFLWEAEQEAVDGADQEIRVGRRPGVTIIEYLGRRLVVRHEPPPLRVRLYPTSLLFAVGAVHVAHTVLLGELPARAVAPSLALLGLGAWRFWRRPPDDDDELDLLMALTTAATVAGFAVSATHRGPPVTAVGWRSSPATSFAKAALLVLSPHWSRLRPAHRLLLPAALLGWLAATHRDRRRPVELVAGLLDLLQIVFSTWRVNDYVDLDSDHLEDELRAEFSTRCEAARREGVAHELERYDRQLAVARRALAETAGSLPDSVRRELERDCTELARWLEGERTRP